MSAITTLIVDDEMPALQRMQRLLSGNHDFLLAGSCVNGKEALEILAEIKIDLLLLDIEMPLMSGLALLERLDDRNKPLVVFVTAYDEYAITAFEYYAIDYLLKPFTNERFEKMLFRVTEHFKHYATAPVSWYDVKESITHKKLPGSRIAIKTGRKYHFIEPLQIAYVIVDGNYCNIKLHSGEKFVYRETLSNLLSVLPSGLFERIHHSYLVAISAVRQINRLGYGEMEVRMHDGSVLKVSRKYKEVVKKLMVK
jgi:two-component system LytT family response regulator